MKKFLLLLTTMVLLFMFTTTSLAEAEPYTIWDIPWDTTKDEIVDVVFTNTGIKLEAFEEHRFWSSREQPISILGQDVKSVILRFNESKNYLENIGINYPNARYSVDSIDKDAKTINNTLVEMAMPFIELYEKLYTKYGAWDFSEVAYNNDAGDHKFSSIKAIEDPEDLAGLVAMGLTNKEPLVILEWRNVTLYAQMWISHDTLIVLTSITYNCYVPENLADPSQAANEIDIADFLMPEAVNIGL